MITFLSDMTLRKRLYFCQRQPMSIDTESQEPRISSPRVASVWVQTETLQDAVGPGPCGKQRDLAGFPNPSSPRCNVPGIQPQSWSSDREERARAAKGFAHELMIHAEGISTVRYGQPQSYEFSSRPGPGSSIKGDHPFAPDTGVTLVVDLGWFRWIHSDGRAPPASSQANTSLIRDRQAKARRLAVGFAFGCNGGRNEAKMEK
jgi:hypothetical protein